jgi:hypothetical protein
MARRYVVRPGPSVRAYPVLSVAKGIPLFLRIKFQLVSAYFSLFQLISAYFSLFQLISAYFRIRGKKGAAYCL